jgi:hypothetical protein
MHIRPCTRLPEFCLVLPTGEVIDFPQYDDNIALPAEVGQDETVGINAMLTVQFEEAPVKRSRPDENTGN